MITSKTEDYLETIFEIEMEGQIPSVTELAARTGVRKATVVVAIKKMVEAGLLLHERYGKILLTRAGLELALRIYRRHKQLTFLFSGVLGIDETVSEQMACSLEHHVSPEAERRLAGFVDCILEARNLGAKWLKEMDAAMNQPRALSLPLAMMEHQDTGTVDVFTCPPERIAEFAQMGITKGAKLRRDGNMETLTVFVDNAPTPIELPLVDGVSIWVMCTPDS